MRKADTEVANVRGILLPAGCFVDEHLNDGLDVVPLRGLGVRHRYLCEEGLSRRSLGVAEATTDEAGYRDIVLFFDFLHKLLEHNCSLTLQERIYTKG